MAAAKGQALRERFARDPDLRARQVQASQQRLAVWRATEDGQSKLRATAAHANAAHARSRTAWLPDNRRAEYETLRKSLGSREAKRIIMADMTPHERQLARVASGERLIAKPVLRRPDHDFTLGGVATGLL